MDIISNAAAASDKQVEWRPRKGLAALLAALFLIANLIALKLPHMVPVLHISGTHWNWSGKIIAIALSCAVLVCSPWLRQNVGLRSKQSTGSWRVSLPCFLMCFGSGIASGFYFWPAAFSLETMCFQALMPTLDEELSFRGIALALMERECGQSPMSCRLHYGRAAFILALIFALMHAVGMEHGRLNFDLFPLFGTFFFASVATIARARSGSLLWPMLCHSAWNVAAFGISMMR